VSTTLTKKWLARGFLVALVVAGALAGVMDFKVVDHDKAQQEISLKNSSFAAPSNSSAAFPSQSGKEESVEEKEDIVKEETVEVKKEETVEEKKEETVEEKKEETVEEKKEETVEEKKEETAEEKKEEPVEEEIVKEDYQCDKIQSLSGEKIPNKLLFNSKGGLAHENDLIKENTIRIQKVFANWTVTDDTDETCLKKILSLDFMKSGTAAVEHWYKSGSTNRQRKSELCRMAQIYLEGGVYVDNDLGLLETSLLVEDLEGMDVLTATGPARYGTPNLKIWLGILGASPNHPLIRKSLEYAKDVLLGTLDNEQYPIGPFVLWRAINETYKDVDDFAHEQKMACKGVFLLTERIQHADKLPPGRRKSTDCEYGFERYGKLYGYSRITQTDGTPCN
jgi:hypothetical protein